MTDKIDELAQEIRRVDGNNSLGAGALAEALMPFIARISSIEGKEPVAWKAIGGDGMADVDLSREIAIQWEKDGLEVIPLYASPAPPVEGTADAIPSKVRGWPKPGDKMRFLDEGGYPRDLVDAHEYFTKGQIETVRDFHLGDWNSTIAFEGIPGHFNSVMFEHADDAALTAIGARDE